jgi:hypothetical protein
MKKMIKIALLILILFIVFSCLNVNGSNFPYESQVNLIVYPYDDAVPTKDNLALKMNTKYEFGSTGHQIDYILSSENSIIEIELTGIIYPTGGAGCAMTPARSTISLAEFNQNGTYELKIYSNNRINEARIEMTDSSCILIPVKNRNVDFKPDTIRIQSENP